MKLFPVIYFLLKMYVRLGLSVSYRRQQVFGLETVPKDKPVLLLSNHQNALLDILLIASKYPRPMHYLARADVFKNNYLARLLRYLGMHPVFRMRDGIRTLSGNYDTFEEVSQELLQGEHVLIFPEANHSLERRVRPLNKGFTRLIASTLKINPDLPLQLIVVGQNYEAPTQVGDASRILMTPPLDLQTWLKEKNPNPEEYVQSRECAHHLTREVEEAMRYLTTHLGPEHCYARHLQSLEKQKYDFTEPFYWVSEEVPQGDKRRIRTDPFFRGLFRILHAPFIFLWRIFVKPRVPEEEFTSTFRFGFVLLGYPLMWMIILWVSSRLMDWVFALTLLAGFLFLHAICGQNRITTDASTVDTTDESEGQQH